MNAVLHLTLGWAIGFSCAVIVIEHSWIGLVGLIFFGVMEIIQLTVKQIRPKSQEPKTNE